MTDCYALTPREQAVVSLVRHGLANKEIAIRLGIRLTTVKGHLESAFRKTGSRSRVQLVLGRVA